MNFRNQSIPADSITSTDVNKAIQRSLTKAVARHGLGLYIYAGEDLPEEEKPENKVPQYISMKEQAVIAGMVKDKGYEVGEIFPKGLNLTSEQYLQAIETIKKLKAKK